MFPVFQKKQCELRYFTKKSKIPSNSNWKDFEIFQKNDTKLDQKIEQ